MRRPGRRADAGVSTSGRDTADQRFNEILAKGGQQVMRAVQCGAFCSNHSSATVSNVFAPSCWRLTASSWRSWAGWTPCFPSPRHRSAALAPVRVNRPPALRASAFSCHRSSGHGEVLSPASNEENTSSAKRRGPASWWTRIKDPREFAREGKSICNVRVDKKTPPRGGA